MTIIKFTYICIHPTLLSSYQNENISSPSLLPLNDNSHNSCLLTHHPFSPLSIYLLSQVDTLSSSRTYLARSVGHISPCVTGPLRSMRCHRPFLFLGLQGSPLLALFPHSCSYVSVFREGFSSSIRVHKQIPSRPVTGAAATCVFSFPFLPPYSKFSWFWGGCSLKTRAGRLSSVQGGEEEEGTLSNPALSTTKVILS